MKVVMFLFLAVAIPGILSLLAIGIFELLNEALFRD